MKEVTVRTFAGGICAPFYDYIRSALTALIEMRWVDVGAESSEGDWAEYRRLCLAESPDFILNLLDYYVFYTYSMFRGGCAGERFFGGIT
jgi:demethylmenaquinone methyltransferase/2-methoxy-6-polyprenyl-1,4-benzoquinol methylase